MNRETLEERMHLRQSLAEIKELIQTWALNCYKAGRLDALKGKTPTLPNKDSQIPKTTLDLIDYFVEVAENLDVRLAYIEQRLNELKENSHV